MRLTGYLRGFTPWHVALRFWAIDRLRAGLYRLERLLTPE